NTLFLILFFTLAGFITHAQTGRISGHVQDKQGNGLISVSVGIPEQGIGTITDENGNYTLDGIKAGTVQLKITAVGYEENVSILKIAEGKTVTYNVTLASGSSALDEVVITGSLKVVRKYVRYSPVDLIFYAMF